MSKVICLAFKLIFICVIAINVCYCQKDVDDIIRETFSTGLLLTNGTSSENDLIDSIFTNKTLNNDDVIVVGIIVNI